MPNWMTEMQTHDIDPPTVYQHEDEIPATETGPYLQLSGSSSRLADTEISVINGAGNTERFWW